MGSSSGTDSEATQAAIRLEYPEVDDGRQPPQSGVSAEQALALIADGVAVLSVHQAEPPTGVLELIERRLGAVEVFGPAAADPETLSKVSGAVIAHGVRQGVVDGNRLRWWEGLPSFELAAQRMLSRCSVREQDLIDQARRVLSHYLKTRAGRKTIRGPVSRDMMNAERLIAGRTGNFLEHSHDYLVVSGPWFTFRLRLRTIKERLHQTLLEALADGRILCCETHAGGDRLVHPEEAAEIALRATEREMNFCCSRDLPVSWFETPGQRRRRARDAARWMAATYNRSRQSGMYATVSDLRTVATDRFGVSDDAVQTAWRELPERPAKMGRVPAELKLSVSKIKELY